MVKTLLLMLFSALSAILGIVVFVLLAVLPTWLLWNWLMPGIFHVREITFWETVGVLFLSGFLFKPSSSSSSS